MKELLKDLHLRPQTVLQSYNNKTNMVLAQKSDALIKGAENLDTNQNIYGLLRLDKEDTNIHWKNRQHLQNGTVQTECFHIEESK